MKIKDLIYLSIASMTSIVMFTSATICSSLNINLFGLDEKNYILLWVLQIILIIKSTCGTILIMPNKIGLKEMVYGFITADIVIAIWFILGMTLFIFPLQVLIVQMLVLVFYRGIRFRNPIRKGHFMVINIKHEFATEGVI